MSNVLVPANDSRRMYSDLAWLYPTITPPAEWQEEADEIWQSIIAKSEIPVRSLLDLGCGAGHMDYYWKDRVCITGVDCSQEMLGLARQLNPGLTYHIGDMRTIRLSALFDTVFISDALVYMLTEDNLRDSFTTAYQHLRVGGVFITYLEAFRDRPEMNTVRHSTSQHNGLMVTHIEHYCDPDPSDNNYEMTFVNLIRRNAHLSVEVDRHLGGLFTVDTYRKLLIQVEFEVEQTILKTFGVPMFVCLKKGKGR